MAFKSDWTFDLFNYLSARTVYKCTYYLIRCNGISHKIRHTQVLVKVHISSVLCLGFVILVWEQGTKGTIGKN